MANTYTWKIISMDCLPSSNGQTNVVVNVHWTCTGSNESNPPITSSVNNVMPITFNAQNTFIPFVNLTEVEVINWVQTYLGQSGVQATQNSIDFMISQQINPPIITPALPW